MTNAYEEHGDYRMQAKAYRRRNSDYRDLWEKGVSAGVRGVTLTEYDLPTVQSGQLTTPDYDEAAAIRHEHVWSVNEDGSDV